FFVGYSTNSKAFRVFNSRTRIVKENLHVKFREDTPNIAGNEPKWLFDIDALTKSMNYELVVAGNQTNGSTGTKACDYTSKARMETVLDRDYILLPLFSLNLKDSPDVGFQPSGEEEKKDAEHPENKGNQVLNSEEPRVNQEKDNDGCEDDPNMPNLEEIIYSDNEGIGAEADMTNQDTHILSSPISTNRIHKDHPVDQIIRDLHSAPQTRRMTKNVTKHGYTQEEGVDYDEVYAPVARIEAIRLFLAYASFKDFIVYQMDVKTAFLYGKIENEVYVYQPLGFEDPEFLEEPRVNQEKDNDVNSTDNINTVILTINVASTKDNVVDENIVYGCEDDPNMPNLEEIIYFDNEGIGAEADMTNQDTHILASPISTNRIHKDHPVDQIIRDLHSAPQTRRMTKNVTKHDEGVYKKLGNSLVRAATTVSRLEAK
nr:putative ribonuclease H-like domain-containing protein [Tanacetum cinerariifolium]